MFSDARDDEIQSKSPVSIILDQTIGMGQNNEV